MNFTKALYRKLKSLGDKFDNFLKIVVGVQIGLAALTILFQVFYRFIIVKFVSFSFPFTEEFSRYMIIWSAYLAIGICLKEGLHASVGIVPNILNDKGKKILYLFQRLLMIGFLIVVLYYSKGLLETTAMFKTPTMRWPGYVIYSSVPVGCFLMLMQILIEMLGVAVNEKKPFAHHIEEEAFEHFGDTDNNKNGEV